MSIIRDWNVKSPIRDDETMRNSAGPAAPGIALLALLLLGLGVPACSGGGVPDDSARQPPSVATDQRATSPAPPEPVDLPPLEGKGAGALRMKARLEAIIENLDPRHNDFLNAT